MTRVYRNALGWLALASTLATIGVPQAACAQPVPSSAESKSKANEHYKRGVRLYEEGDYQTSLIEFRAAYQLAPAYQVAYNVGRAYQQLQNYAGALTWFERYQREGAGNLPPARLTELQREIDELRRRVAYLDLRAAKVQGASVYVDDELQGETPLAEPIRVSAGRRRLRVVKPGYGPYEIVLDLAGLETRAIDVVLTELKPSDQPSQPAVLSESRERWERWTTLSWAGLGAAGLLGVGAVVTGVVTYREASNVRDDGKAGPAATDDNRYQRAQNFGLATDILAGAAIVSAGVTLALTLGRQGPSTNAKAASPWGLSASARGLGVQLQRSFLPSFEPSASAASSRPSRAPGRADRCARCSPFSFPSSLSLLPTPTLRVSERRMNPPPSLPSSRLRQGVARSHLLGALLLSPLGLSNCSAWVNEFVEQCETDADCVGKGDSFLGSTCEEGICRRAPASAVDPKWACVGQVDWPAPTRSSVRVNFTLSLLGPNLPVEGSSIRACFRNDDDCSVAAAGPIITNGNGQASIDVPTNITTPGSLGFNGYFEITGPRHSPYLYVPTPPIVAEREAVLLVSTLEGFARVLQTNVPDLTLAPERAILSLQSRDCEQKVTAGARFQALEADAQTRSFYLLNGSFTPAASATDATGISVIANVPTTTGQATVVGTSDQVDGRTLSLALPVRAAHITFTEAPPTP